MDRKEKMDKYRIKSYKAVEEYLFCSEFSSKWSDVKAKVESFMKEYNVDDPSIYVEERNGGDVRIFATIKRSDEEIDEEIERIEMEKRAEYERLKKEYE